MNNESFRLIPVYFRGAVRMGKPIQRLHYPFRCRACGAILPEGARVIGTSMRVGDEDGEVETVFVHADPCGEQAAALARLVAKA